MKSTIPDFYRLGPKKRLELVRKFAKLNSTDMRILRDPKALPFSTANNMVENAIGSLSYPLGIATNFLINGKDYLLPMAIEEPSVIAAASNAAKMARAKDGFTASSDPSLMLGQVQVVGVEPYSAGAKVLVAKSEILGIANQKSRTLAKSGAGAKDVTFRVLETERGSMLIVELVIDVRDAMGANIVNTMCEAVAPTVEKLTGGRVLLRVLSNHATKRLARASAVFSKEELGGKDVVEGILLAYVFAAADQYRCTTHNKGVMNGIIAVANATGQDTRAIEAGAHSYACRNGRYMPLTQWSRNDDGDLVGNIELPLAVGTVGGVAAVHPLARTCLKILRVRTAGELACVMASAGLAQNLAALRALVAEGIQRGHMRLHARNVAVLAGADAKFIDVVAKKISDENNITVQRAKEVLRGLKRRS